VIKTAPQIVQPDAPAMPAKATAPQKRIDRSALMLMLSYMEAECRELGAADSARHIAEAAALLRATSLAEAADPQLRLLRHPLGTA
jgi:hypothetical protein